MYAIAGCYVVGDLAIIFFNRLKYLSKDTSRFYVNTTYI